MQRLVYSPKVFAYIKTEDQIVDVSDFIVSGSVSRKVNQVSSATLVLRNPHKRFTNPGVFTPMDPITIYLQRLRNRPVRVFTGYLDQTPYLQLYPGIVSLRASCTLKKLLYKFWDPALPFTGEFMSKRGWIVNAQDGTIRNPDILGEDFEELSAEDKQKAKAKAKEEEKQEDADTAKELKDGNIGLLLHDTLTEVVEWPTENIFIEKLPETIVPLVRQLYMNFETDNKEAIGEFEALLKHIIGEASLGGGGGDDSGEFGGGSVMDLLEEAGWPESSRKQAAATMICESPKAGKYLLDPKGKGGAGGKMLGMWQFNPADTFGRNPREVKCALEPLCATKQALKLFKERGLNPWSCFSGGDGQSYRGLFKKDLKDIDKYKIKGYSGKKKDEDEDTKATGNDRTGNTPARGSRAAKFGEEASSGAGGIPTRSARAQATGNDRTGNTAKPDEKDDEESDKPNLPAAKKWLGGNKNYAEVRGNRQHAGEDYQMPNGTSLYAVDDGTVKQLSNPGGYGTYADLHMAGGLVARYAHLQSVTKRGRVSKGDVIAKSNNTGSSTGPHLHFEIRQGSGFGFEGTKDPADYLKGAISGSGGDDSGGGGGGGGGGGLGAEEIMSFAKATTFATTLQWPGIEESILAEGLQGQKSLMNDIPVFDWIEQLSQASLRHFQSMPNGDFFAFYPDQFGLMGGRKPYWMINDIEILDGSIELNDESLATHVYVVGDTNANGAIDFHEKIFSGGVVSIFNVFAEDLLASDASGNNLDRDRSEDPKDESKRPKPKIPRGTLRGRDKELTKSIPSFGNTDDALAFLQRYGARPSYNEMPEIRNPYFESFMAFQMFMKMWATQFLTTFTFTFMPELFPGGQVGFPEHGLQMYIEEVEHTFDYEQGFTTQANLSAPSVLDGAEYSKRAGKLPPNMLHALSGRIRDLDEAERKEMVERTKPKAEPNKPEKKPSSKRERDKSKDKNK